MKKFFLIAFLVFDLALVGGGSFVLYAYVTHKGVLDFNRKSTAVPTVPATATSPGLVSVSTTTSSANPVSSTNSLISAPVTASATEPGTRKILFQYRNSKANKVFIRADFTGWKAEAMQKNASTGVWIYQANLTPGEYAYCFTADDKTFKDPFNKRTKPIGRTLVSAIVVEPLASSKSK